MTIEAQKFRDHMGGYHVNWLASPRMAEGMLKLEPPAKGLRETATLIIDRYLVECVTVEYPDGYRHLTSVSLLREFVYDLRAEKVDPEPPFVHYMTYDEQTQRLLMTRILTIAEWRV